MSPDLGSFLGQILPGVFFVYIVIPAVIMLLWFLLFRPYLRKRGWLKPKETSSTSQITPPSPIPSIGSLTQTSPRVDTDMLPDLDMILQQEAEHEAQQMTTPAQPNTITLNTGTTRQVTPVFTILRDESDGRLMVAIDGIGYRSLKDTGEPKQIFTRIMKELSGTILQADADTPAPQPEITTPQPESEPSQPASAPSQPPAPKRTTELPPLPDGRLPGDLPSYKFDDNPAKIEQKSGGRVKVEFTPPPELDIPGAIEAYLQYKIQYVPEFQGREIHVLPAPDGGVRIQVGQTYFETVADVSDEAVRTFLQETIAEWQDRQ